MNRPFDHTSTHERAEDHASAPPGAYQTSAHADTDQSTPQPRAHHRCDILIAGAGFAGALTALILNRSGFSVCVVEKGRHPRFAIGESSTPIADLLLRELSTRYDLPWLYPFSRYGSWQEAHPEIVCGIKRGFSYFKHYPGKEFATDAAHSQELLVAASSSDRLSDTNWLRADFDAFLVEQVKDAGITYLDNTDIVSARRDGHWTFHADRPADAHDINTDHKAHGAPSPNGTPSPNGDSKANAAPGPNGATLAITAKFFIDATGGGSLLNSLLGIKSSSADFETNSYGLFSHFDDLPRWTDWLQRAGIPTHDFPYDPDHSALHQVLDEGWIWMLRFNDRRTSVGFALDGRKAPPGEASPQQQWEQLLQKYPSIGRLFKDATLSSAPGKLIRSGRLQRKAERCWGPGWAALPHTAGFVDPLFSSGIAHSLTGISKLTRLLENHWNNADALQEGLREYEQAIFTELQLIDKLVAGCYLTMPSFGLFQAWSMLYFAATITCEQRLLRGEPGGYFLGADNPAIRQMVEECWAALLPLCNGEHLPSVAPSGPTASFGQAAPSGQAPPRLTAFPAQPSSAAIRLFTDLVREKIAPFNIAGLMDPEARNMYRHTVAVL